MIIHTINTMTVRQYSQYESDRKPVHLFRRFKWLARFGFFPDDIQQFIESFNKAFSDSQDNDLYRSFEKLRYEAKLLAMEGLLTGMQLHVFTRADMQELARKAGKSLKPDELFGRYRDEIMQITGIEINEMKDIKAFADELTRKIDKYREIFKEKEKAKGSTIMELFFSCCMILEQSPDYSKMTLSELATFKAQAHELARKREEQYKK